MAPKIVPNWNLNGSFSYKTQTLIIILLIRCVVLIWIIITLNNFKIFNGCFIFDILMIFFNCVERCVIIWGFERFQLNGALNDDFIEILLLFQLNDFKNFAFNLNTAYCCLKQKRTGKIERTFQRALLVNSYNKCVSKNFSRIYFYYCQTINLVATEKFLEIFRQ